MHPRRTERLYVTEPQIGILLGVIVCVRLYNCVSKVAFMKANTDKHKEIFLLMENPIQTNPMW